MSGKLSRNKGAAFEREIAQILREHGWSTAERTSNGRVQYGKGDFSGGPQGCHIEAKRAERLNVAAAFDQVVRDADPQDIPILVHRPSRHEVMATLPLAELLPLFALRERGL